MTTEEKLKHFQEICMTDAREKSARMLDDCVRALDAAFEEHKAEAERRAAMQEEAQKEKLEREKNKKLSIGQLDLKREISRRQEELKDKLFGEVRICWRILWKQESIRSFWNGRSGALRNSQEMRR